MGARERTCFANLHSNSKDCFASSYYSRRGKTAVVLNIKLTYLHLYKMLREFHDHVYDKIKKNDQIQRRLLCEHKIQNTF